MSEFDKLFPKAQGEGWDFRHPSYRELVDTFGEVVLEVSDHDWQGDSRFLLRDYGKRWGYLQFGWGSCSGCDALEACCCRKDLEELWISLRNDIKWFPSKAEAARFFDEHDWEGDYSWHEEEQKEFIKKAKELLGR